jgi:Protein of unknown function (DUF2605)
MPLSEPTEKELLKAVLTPLLEDFKYWFSRSQTFLESEQIAFFSEKEQKELLQRVQQSYQEVNTAQILFQAMGGEVGIDPKILVPWHKLVTECWQVRHKWRKLQDNSDPNSNY